MISYPQVFLFLSTSLCSLSCMGLQKHTLHAMQRTSGKRLKLAGLPPLPMRCHAPNWFSAVNMDKDSQRPL